MQSLATAFGKASAQGKLTGENVQMMIDAGWNPLIQISEAAGETMEETQKRMSDGAISVDELKAAMQAATSEGGQFAGGMEKASKTTEGLMSTLQDNAKALVGEVFQPISDSLLQEVLPNAISYIDKLSTAFKTDGVDGLVSAASEIIGEVITTIVSKSQIFFRWCKTFCRASERQLAKTCRL
jgi:tape measure domain